MSERLIETILGMAIWAGMWLFLNYLHIKMGGYTDYFILFVLIAGGWLFIILQNYNFLGLNNFTERKQEKHEKGFRKSGNR